MTHWFRVRRAWVMVETIALLAVLMVAGGDHTVAVPTVIGGGTGAIVWSTFVPLGWAAVVAYAFEHHGTDAEARPVRRLWAFDIALVAVMSGLAAGVFAVTGSGETLAQVAAHVLLVSGLTAGVTVCRGSGTGILGTTVLVLLTFSYGVSAPGADYVRVLQPDGDVVWSFAVGVAAFVAGLATIWWRRESPPRGSAA